MEELTIRVVRAKARYWYAKFIGCELQVYDGGQSEYILKTAYDSGNTVEAMWRGIDKNDAEIIKSNSPQTPSEVK
jgi:hypothetical protein